MEQSQDSEDYGGDAGPWLTVPQAEAYADTAGTQNQQRSSDEIDCDWDQCGEELLFVNHQVQASAEEDQAHGGDQKEAAHDHPEHAESVEMALKAGLRHGADGVSEAACALRAGYGVGWNLGSAAVAEHGDLLMVIRRKSGKVPGG